MYIYKQTRFMHSGKKYTITALLTAIIIVVVIIIPAWHGGGSCM